VTKYRATLLASGKPEAALTVADVHRALCEMAETSGSLVKCSLLATLLRRSASAPLQARFLVRHVTGELRIGIAAISLLDAVATSFAGLFCLLLLWSVPFLNP
jgi:DNA ligase-1